MTNTEKLITVCLFAIVACFTGCQSGENKNSNDNNSQEQESEVKTDVIQNPGGKDGDKSQMPELSFEKKSHDFGKVTKGEKVAHSFKFTNTGEGELVIANANPSCGCTVPNHPKKPIEPGESGFIDVVFDSEGRGGKFEKSITIMSNNPGEPIKLYITGKVTS